MNLVDHVEGLLGWEGGHDDNRRDAESIQSINESLQAILHGSSSYSAGHVQPVEALEGVEQSTSRLIWDDLIELSIASHGVDEELVQDDIAYEAAQKRTSTSQLITHLRSMSQGDDELFKSVLSDVQTYISDSSASDEALSSALAESLGFDQLDLVMNLVQERKQVGEELKEFTLVGIQPADATISKAPREWHDTRLLRSEGPLTPLSSSAKPYIPGSSMVIQTKEQILEAKRRRAEARRYERAKSSHLPHNDQEDSGLPYTAEQMAMLRAQSLHDAAQRPLFSSDQPSSTNGPVYPHVYASQNGGGGSVLSAFGAKFSLPMGTTRTENSFYDEVTIPPPKQLPMRLQERLIPISEMDSLAKGAFPGYASLNRLQSAVYPLAYHSNENLLICAPTGAGKTDVAMLTVLRTIRQHARKPEATVGDSSSNAFGVRYDDFKIIYVAPMKALASEIVAKFSKRLRYLGVKVRELTGDMQLTRQEIAETQMIVTTPEKWDVVTRKPTGEGELATQVRLLIIDEVHLLHEDRGAVIETIVARTLRLVESSQSLIRIVGLSATLPNYVDVADFLRVNRYQGLFFFDGSFRPVPLEQHFLGVQGKVNSAQSRMNHDKATFEKLSTLVEQGHQVMIFVHARKETVKTATTMREMCKEEGLLEVLLQAREDGSMAGKANTFRRDIMESRNRELKELFESGFGIHHAGMLRKDRNLSERLFESGVTRVLCCTSTLAWGVNLPAYAVLIKGTDVYDSSLGRFSDLSILDVLQIFGRAGRPQYESVGVGYIVTSQDKLSHYVDAITSQHPIESRFKTGIIDALNAEVALGSVSNVADGVTWLSYTYLFTRMKRNPLAYGMVMDEVAEDPQLGSRRLTEITTAAKYLSMCKMMQFDSASGQFTITDLGRIAAKYYISYRTIEIFNARLKNDMSEADILAVFAQGTDFEQVIPRDGEVQELKTLEERVPCQIVGACETPAGKTNLLLQAYISRLYIDDFALVSDTGYVSQNAGRIMRALLEISLSNRWASTSRALLGLTKSVEKRLWAFDHPLDPTQSGLKADLVYQVKRWADDVEIKTLASMDREELAKLCKVNARHAEAIIDAAKAFPTLAIDYKLKPITHDLVSINIAIHADFLWKESRTSSIEPFLIWIETEDEVDILQWKRVILRPQTGTLDVAFLVDALSTATSGLWIRWASDRWLGSEDQIHVPFEQLIMPPVPRESTPLLELPLLSTKICLNGFESSTRQYYQQRMASFNSLQTQAFHHCIHSSGNLLLCMPRRSGRTTLTHLAISRTSHKRQEQGLSTLNLSIYPNHHLATQSYLAFNRSIAGDSQVKSRICKTVSDLATGTEGSSAVCLFATPAPILQLFAAGDPTNLLSNLSLVVAEDIDCLDAAYELALCQLMRATSRRSLRWIVTSTTLLYTDGMQDWLQIQASYVYNLASRNRPCVLKTSMVTFDIPHSIGLIKAMAKPAYDCIKKRDGKRRALVFVPSRSQAYTTAKDLMTQAAADLDTEAFLGVNSSALIPYLREISDAGLHEPLSAGIGIIYEGMKAHDRSLVLSLYDTKAIRLLVASRDSLWSLDVKCDVVVIMSVQYYRGQGNDLESVLSHSTHGKNTRFRRPFNAKLVDYPLVDITRMQSMAAEASTSADEMDEIDANQRECLVMCQEEQVTFLQRSLDQGCVLESSLLDRSKDQLALLWFIFAEIHRRRVTDASQIVGLLDWSWARRQMMINPSYYGSRSSEEDDISEVMSNLADELVQQLNEMDVLVKTVQGGEAWKVTRIGERAFRNQRLFYALSILASEYKADPGKTATLLLESSVVRGSGKEISTVATLDKAASTVLDATRSCLPSVILAYFHVPKLAKRKDVEGTPEDEKPLKPLQIRALLLAVFLSPGFEIRTMQEASSFVKSKTQAGVSQRRHEVHTSTQEEQDLAKEHLLQQTVELVENLLVR